MDGLCTILSHRLFLKLTITPFVVFPLSDFMRNRTITIYIVRILTGYLFPSGLFLNVPIFIHIKSLTFDGLCTILLHWLLLKLTITPLIIFSFSDLYSNITFRSNIVSVFSGNFLPSGLFIRFSGCIHIVIFFINFLDRVGCCIYFCIRCCGYCHTGKHRQNHTCSY